MPGLGQGGVDFQRVGGLVVAQGEEGGDGGPEVAFALAELVVEGGCGGRGGGGGSSGGGGGGAVAGSSGGVGGGGEDGAVGVLVGDEGFEEVETAGGVVDAFVDLDVVGGAVGAAGGGGDGPAEQHGVPDDVGLEALRDGRFPVVGGQGGGEAEEEGGVHFAEAGVGEEVGEAAGGEPARFEELVDAGRVDGGVDVFDLVEGGGREGVGGRGYDWWGETGDVEEVVDCGGFCYERKRGFSLKSIGCMV